MNQPSGWMVAYGRDNVTKRSSGKRCAHCRDGSERCQPRSTSAGRHLHLVLAKFLWIKAFEPLLEPFIIGRFGREIGRTGAFDDRLLDQDR
jgi:hypothetical protein